MVSAVDQQRVCALLTEAMTVICKNGLTFNNKFCIEGLLGITMDDSKMFLVNIRETVHKARPDGSKQHKSDSISKAGMLVGGRPVMQQQQQQGLRTGSPMGLGRPGMGVGPGNQQMMQQRRRGGPQPQTIIPAKRPMLAQATGQVPAGVMNQGKTGVGIPQEWAALIQLQQQQRPQGQPVGFQHRGRGRPPTARRGGIYRGGMQQRGVVHGTGDGPVKSPTRRTSQGGVDLETKEEMERKAAEQARSRSERLQRRQAAMYKDGPTKFDPAGSVKDSSSAHESTEDKPTAAESESETDTPSETQHMDTDDGKPTEDDKKEADTIEPTEQSTEDKESTEASDDGKATESEPKEEKEETEKENSTEEGKGETKEGDGSWLLSNSNWLLGDIEAPTNDSSLKSDPGEEDKGEKNDTG